MAHATAAVELSRPDWETVPFEKMPGWAEDDHSAALRAFVAGTGAERPAKTRALGIDAARLRALASAASRVVAGDGRRARVFFESYFRAWRLPRPGFVTGYYEPELPASRSPRFDFPIPLLRRPPDLVEVEPGDEAPGLEPGTRFARRVDGRLQPYLDRAAIEAGALAGQGLEIAWLRDPVDAFFVHVQGSARLRFLDGGTLRVAFAGKSGHAYTSIGRLAVERGILKEAEAHKDGLEAWLRANPEAGRSLMRENRSYIFFRQTALAEKDGPLGAAGVPLTPGRSLAVDRALHTFGTPIWVEAPGVPDPEGTSRPFRRLMIAQDTGSAIVGLARGDIFYGSGAAAGSRAGHVRHEAAFTVLAPAGETAGE